MGYPTQCKRCRMRLPVRRRGRPQLYCEECRVLENRVHRSRVRSGPSAPSCRDCGTTLCLLDGEERDQCAECLAAKPPRRCSRCGDLATSSIHEYCDACRIWSLSQPRRSRHIRRYEPGKTTRQGYGSHHQRLRKAWAVKVEAGGVYCWRCGSRSTRANRGTSATTTMTGAATEDPSIGARIAQQEPKPPAVYLSVVVAVEHDLAGIAKAVPELAISPLAASAYAMARELDSPHTSATSKSMCAKALLENPRPAPRTDAG